MPAADFDAFISYRRSDGTAVAFWLRRELERFRAPRSFGPKFRRKLRVYLDTTYERGYAEFLVRQGQSAEAEGEYGKLLDDSRPLGSIHNHRREFAVAEGEALGQLGDLTDDRGETLNAAERYEAAAEAVRRALKPQGEKQDSQIIGWLARLYRLSGERRMRLGDQDRALASLRQCAEVRRLAPEAAPPAVEHENALVQALILQLERQRGNSQAAELAQRGPCGYRTYHGRSQGHGRTQEMGRRSQDLDRTPNGRRLNKGRSFWARASYFRCWAVFSSP
jgi:tetratricopeptide (TPR) repeat protein